MSFWGRSALQCNGLITVFQNQIISHLTTLNIDHWYALGSNDLVQVYVCHGVHKILCCSGLNITEQQIETLRTISLRVWTTSLAIKSSNSGSKDAVQQEDQYNSNNPIYFLEPSFNQGVSHPIMYRLSKPVTIHGWQLWLPLPFPRVTAGRPETQVGTSPGGESPLWPIQV